MSRKLGWAAIVAATCVFVSGAAAQPVTTAFTYQGQLKLDGVVANGSYDFVFTLFETESGPNPAGVELCADNVPVVDGRFTVTLPGGSFTGNRRWLDIQVRDGAAGDCTNLAGFTPLSPRQEILATPYASYALNAGSSTSAVLFGGQPPSFYQNASNLTSGTVPDTRLSTNVPRLSVANTFTANVTAPAFSGSGASLTALNATNVSTGTLADARLSTNIPRLNAASSIFSGSITATSFAGAGSAITALNATNVSTGTLADARLSTNIPRLNGTNFFTGANAFTDSVGVGTSVPEASLHVRSSDSLGTIIVTPGVADTQSQLVMAENTSVSNAYILRYNGTTNNLEFRGRAADVETAALLTVNRDSATATLGNATEPGRLNINGGDVALSVSSSGVGDSTVVLPPDSIGSSETVNEPGVRSEANVTSFGLAEDVSTTVETVTINAPTAGFVVLIGTVEFENCDVLNATVFAFASASSTVSATAGQSHRIITGCAPATVTTHNVVSVGAGSTTFYLRVLSFNANVSVIDRRLTAMFFPTQY